MIEFTVTEVEVVEFISLAAVFKLCINGTATANNPIIIAPPTTIAIMYLFFGNFKPLTLHQL